MENTTHSTKLGENETIVIEGISRTTTPHNSNNDNTKAQTILTIQSTTASLGIVANFTVIVVFLNHKKLRRKIPNIFIINQVRKLTNECTFINIMHCQRKHVINTNNIIQHQSQKPVFVCYVRRGKALRDLLHNTHVFVPVC